MIPWSSLYRNYPVCCSGYVWRITVQTCLVHSRQRTISSFSLIPSSGSIKRSPNPSGNFTPDGGGPHKRRQPAVHDRQIESSCRRAFLSGCGSLRSIVVHFLLMPVHPARQGGILKAAGLCSRRWILSSRGWIGRRNPDIKWSFRKGS